MHLELKYSVMGEVEGDPGVSQNVEATWSLYLKMGDGYNKRSIREVFDLVINPEIKPEFQQRAIRTLLDLGIVSINDSDTVGFREMILDQNRDSDASSGISWAQKLDGSQARYAAEILPSYLRKVSQGEQMNYPRFKKYISILLDLLPGLSEDAAKKLFDNFDYDFDSKNSLLVLFRRDHGYDVWKEKAIEETRRRKEQMKDSERNFGRYQYADFLRDVSLDNNAVFPGNRKPDQNRVDFFTKEVVYAMSIYPEGSIISSTAYFLSILDRLPPDLRHAFVVRHLNILEKERDILNELAFIFPGDAKILAALEKLITDEEKKRKEVPAVLIAGIEVELKDRVKREAETAEEQRILDLMRKPKPQ